MKVYISVDIEGCAGITHWDEAEKNHADYAEFREQMTREAVAAIEGAQAAGATDIWVKDAHVSGRNLLTSMLPGDVRIIRSWAGHPLCMVQELDDGFDAVMMVGYHSAAGSEANSLAHTLVNEASTIQRLAINGHPASEFYVYALASSMLGVPTVFVSGDTGLMTEVESVNPHIRRGAVKEGRGQSTISMAPAGAVKAIRAAATTALTGNLKASLLRLPEHFVVEITYGNPNLAYRHQFYPGAEHVGNRTIRFETGHYLDVLRMLNYVT
jgi:D-amino peptidase